MGAYGDQLLPRIINVACGMKASDPLRERVCAGLTGEVVEIGFGSGLNVPFYPPAVTRVPVDLATNTGFAIAEVDSFYEKGAPKALGADSLGTAVSPD